jgi:hypothetical protein
MPIVRSGAGTPVSLLQDPDSTDRDGAYPNTIHSKRWYG